MAKIDCEWFLTQGVGSKVGFDQGVGDVHDSIARQTVTQGM